MSTLASTNLPSYSRASFSRSGPSRRHGPHHDAQKSTTTGTVRDRSITSCSKFFGVASITNAEVEFVSLIESIFLIVPRSLGSQSIVDAAQSPRPGRPDFWCCLWTRS